MKVHLAMAALMVSALGFAQTSPQAVEPMGKAELLEMLATEPISARTVIFIQQRGIDFTPDVAFLQSLREDGVEASLLTTVQSARVVPANDAAAPEDRGLLAHLHQAIRLNRNDFHPKAVEPELLAAVADSPTNAFAHLALGKVLFQLHQFDTVASELQTALRILPGLAEADRQLGMALDIDPKQRSAALAHLRKATELAPYDPQAKYNYASAQLSRKGGKDEAKKQGELLKILADAGIPMRFRVGGQTMQSKLIYGPPPEYPEDAKAAHLEGPVMLQTLIGTDGAVKDFEATGESSLVRAATEAVSHWRYSPMTLNHVAAEVVTEIEINFTLDKVQVGGLPRRP